MKNESFWNWCRAMPLAKTDSLRVCIILFLCCLFASAAQAQTILPSAAAIAQQEIEIRIGSAALRVPDSILINQDGEKIRFYSDLIKGKVVVISFFYTSCDYICSIQGEIFSSLQFELGSRLGKDIFLISVSTDPETDVPEKLKSWSERYKRRRGWSLITGSKEEMNKLLKVFTGETVGRRELHSSVVYIGNERRGIWTAFEGISGAEILSKIISEISKGNPGIPKP